MFPAPLDGPIGGFAVDDDKLIVPGRINRRQNRFDSVDFVQSEGQQSNLQRPPIPRFLFPSRIVMTRLLSPTRIFTSLDSHPKSRRCTQLCEHGRLSSPQAIYLSTPFDRTSGGR